jgi:hypothetical protein
MIKAERAGSAEAALAADHKTIEAPTEAAARIAVPPSMSRKLKVNVTKLSKPKCRASSGVP